MQETTSDTEALVCAFLCPPGDQWVEVGWEEINAWRPENGLLWVHLDRGSSGASEYLANAAIDPVAVDALLTEETRPRSVAIGDALLLILRGVNLNPGAEPEDMVSLRIWADSDRLISTRQRRVMAVNDLREQLQRGRGPKATGDFVVAFAAGLVERMGSVIATLDDQADSLEQSIVDAQHSEIRSELGHLRRQAIALRRYLAPQRDALNRLQMEEFSWLDPRSKARLREVNDRVIRHVEDLDAIRERAVVIQDELVNRLSDRMNRNMYVLTLVATVMLPLGFLTGLLGINVDGIPGSQNAPTAFFTVCAALTLVVLIEIWVLRRLRWF